MNVRCACIDIGSNTTRLLVAEPDGPGLREIVTQRVFHRLGGLDGGIPPERVAEVAATVTSQVRLAGESGADHIRIVATAAIRGAANGEQLCAAVRAAAGLPVAVLSCEDEARLAFRGATRMLRDRPREMVAVVDVGGGSTELACGTIEGGVTWSASFPVGSALLADRYLHADPPSADEIERIRTHVAGVLAGLDAPPPVVAYAVGGSTTSMRRLIGDVVDHDTLQRAIRAVCDMPAKEVARCHDLHLERVRVLPAGMLLLDGVSAALGVPLQFAGGGLREGVILGLLGG